MAARCSHGGGRHQGCGGREWDGVRGRGGEGGAGGVGVDLNILHRRTIHT